MSRTSAIRDAWHPQTREDRDAILRELQAVLASAQFCNSKRYPALLKYIVENTLAGNSELLKERTLGVEVFHRPPSYDTNADTVVRYTAGEVRKRLSLYYHGLDHKPVIQISLPAGSYIPEFLYTPEDHSEPASSTSASMTSSNWLPDSAHQTLSADLLSRSPSDFALRAGSSVLLDPISQGSSAASFRRRRGFGIAVIFAVVILSGAVWRYRAVHPNTALNDFWAPVLRDQSAVMVCAGGSVFSQEHLSGVATAGKDIQYPFISMQSASAIASLSGLIERNGATTQLQSAATTPLTELKEHPVILLGGYNNQWSLRLLQPLRFHFSPETAGEAIVDEASPGVRWERDPALPYSSADDYALVARFRDTKTDSWVVVLAGLGRNGTEAAANFATSPHYMQLLRDRLGRDLSNRNVEAVLQLNVIDGKTGAPSIVAVRAW
jgi:hypothetical protein